MKRSEVNRLLRDAAASFARQGFATPPWARFSPADWIARPEQARFCAAHQMGWDVTDFGSGDFEARGLLLLCTRNGIQNRPGERPYAEKIMIVREGQETPFHCHRIKVEDIINRGGGDLVLEVTRFEDDRETSEPFAVLIDGQHRSVAPREPIVLGPGESITLMPGQMHRFYGKPGRGIVVVGEVSQCNDDHGDNVFLEAQGRFATIDEDQSPIHPLWSELAVLLDGVRDARPSSCV